MEASQSPKSAISKNGSFSRLLSNSGQTLSLALVLIALFVFFSLTTDAFMTQPNLINIMRQVSFTGITAVGAAMVLLIGGIDLSIGSVLAFTGVIAAKAIIEAGMPPLVGIFAGISAGMLGRSAQWSHHHETAYPRPDHHPGHAHHCQRHQLYSDQRPAGVRFSQSALFGI